MDRSLHIVFVMVTRGSTRLFEPVLRDLAERGHRLTLAFDRRKDDQTWAQELIDRLQADHPAVAVEFLDLPDEWHPWTRLFTDFSRSLDYVNYFKPQYANANAVRDRQQRKAPPLTGRIMTGPIGRSERGRRLVPKILRAGLSATPAGPGVEAWLAERRPDVLALTPLVDGRRQPEFVRAARKLGIPTVACIRSWDNLSTKGMILEAPDRVTVWNETMRREAIEMHAVPPERLTLTGAQVFDKWFDRGPSEEREAFMAPLGLDPGRPMLLYLCSSKFIAGPGEPDWVRRWLAAVRAHPAMEGIGVLVRPHPKSGEYWRDVDLGPNTAVFPQVGSETDTAEAQDVFYDSIHHAAAVTGVNTSALIESAIIGRPVLSVLTEDFRRTQEESIHFNYLHTVAGGAVIVDESLDAHVERLAGFVQRTVPAPDATEFVRAFVRPHGLDRAATPILTDAIESTADLVPEPPRAPAWAPLARPALALLGRISVLRRRRLVGSSRVDLQACKLEYSIVSPK